MLKRFTAEITNLNLKTAPLMWKGIVVLGAVMLSAAFLSNPARAQLAPAYSNSLLMDDDISVFFMADRLEYTFTNGPDPLAWDAQGYIGSDYHKFWFKAEGEALTSEKEGEMEFQGLYSRAISPFFDFQTGIRYDIAYSDAGEKTRGFAVIGLQGLAPYFFEIDGSLFISEAGDISAAFEAEYDLPITQRLWGQPRLATNISLQEVEEWGGGSGVNDLQLEFRLRYEIKRELAPYVGVSWTRKLGDTADFTRIEGGETSLFGLVGGVRFWI